MSLYCIADLHLSTLASTNKSMEVFGRRWEKYTERLQTKWRALITDEDTVVIGGDISWALSLDEALCDLRFIDALPGRKILLKGNHDFWWSTMKKHTDFCEANRLRTISFLFNNAYATDDLIIAGTRGWFQDDDAPTVREVDMEKIQRRELMRLQASLHAAEALRATEEHAGKEIVVFTHFPVVFGQRSWNDMLDTLEHHGIRRVYYGHIHGQYALPPVTRARAIDFHLVSADFLDFLPKFVPTGLF